jgi:hypothetical protein
MFRGYGYGASRAPCQTVLLGAAPVSQPIAWPSTPKNWHQKKWRGAFRSNATVQVLPGLAGDVPSPSLIMRTKSQQNVKAKGLNAPPTPALSILDDISFVADKDARSLFGCGPL